MGKNNSKSFDSEIKKYFKRINSYINFSIIYSNNSKTLYEKVKSLRKKKCLIFLLDEKGVEYNSLKFSNFIEKKIYSGINNITFIIGDHSGYSKFITDNFNNKISLSKMTFSHQMVRLIFKEQLYRAFTIIKGEKYHHE